MTDKNDPDKKLTHGYEKMLHHLQASLNEFGEHAKPHVNEALLKAKETTVKLGHLTVEEAETIAEYLRRDVVDAARFMVNVKKLFADWLYFDAKLVEAKLLEISADIADKTSLELLEFNYELDHGPEYHSGEITGLGTLECINCGEVLHFHKISHIPPCPKCHHGKFQRLKHQDDD
ncbi:MAG: hypothetical protein CMF50_05940 [Legionellales bacterium]|nr:hypothetical protein [Legionellales bacterium]|tara:strand:- start:68810 stop:69337 length:528 start_codon:yes stop_codon:yes gene_type:complete